MASQKPKNRIEFKNEKRKKLCEGKKKSGKVLQTYFEMAAILGNFAL